MDFQHIFGISSQSEFESVALEMFRHQFSNNSVYRQFCEYMGKDPKSVRSVHDIPHLPVSFFKDHKIITGKSDPEIVFRSSGTTGSVRSSHYVTDLELYHKSLMEAFSFFYGDIKDYCIIAVLPDRSQEPNSSLVYMADRLIRESGHPKSGFYFQDNVRLRKTLSDLDADSKRTWVIGLSYALLDACSEGTLDLKHCTLLETGGMKGKRKEIIRKELHDLLKSGFGLSEIHSEYGMTELLSQAYARGTGVFFSPPWMQISIREIEDPLAMAPIGKTGGINIIDLANMNSCSFLAVQDLGRATPDGGVEVLGRFDHADIRGCNLMAL